MIIIKEYNKHPEGFYLKLEYSFYLFEDSGTFEIVKDNKEEILKAYISNAMTDIGIMIDEFLIVTLDRILPHFSNPNVKPYQYPNEKLEDNCTILKQFIERNREEGNIHKFAVNILKEIPLFQNVLVNHKDHTFNRNTQLKIINNIKTMAKHIKEGMEKLHDMQKVDSKEELGETVGECKT